MRIKTDVWIFVADFTKYNYISVGILNHEFAIQRSISKRFKIFDFMRGNERYKYELGGIDKLIYSITISK